MLIGAIKGHITKPVTPATASSNFHTTDTAIKTPAICPTSASNALDAAIFASTEASGLVRVLIIAGLGRHIRIVAPKLSLKERRAPRMKPTTP
jgi:hypothetical protein